MVGCLALMTRVHAILERRSDSVCTVCGLLIENKYASQEFFTEAKEAVSCEVCRLRTITRADASPVFIETMDPKAVVRRLLETALSECEAKCLYNCIEGRLLSRLPIERVKRLHDLFPNWRARLEDLVVEKDTVVACYRVTCVDQFGLQVANGIPHNRLQAVILKVDTLRVIDARPIVDDFDIWNLPESALRRGGSRAGAPK